MIVLRCYYWIINASIVVYHIEQKARMKINEIGELVAAYFEIVFDGVTFD